MERIADFHLAIHILRRSARRLLGLLAAVILIATAAWAVYAQAPLARVQIMAANYATFPRPSLFVAPKTEEGRVLSDIPAEAFRVKENGVLTPIDTVSKENVGISLAIVLDASGSINAPGATGKLRREEAIDIIDELVMTDNWLDKERRNTYVILIVPKGKTDYEILQPWTNDYVRIHNQVYTFDYQAQKTDTPLYAMLIEAIQRMDESPAAKNAQKIILVISDGIDRTSAEAIGDVIARANNKQIQILGVKLGPERAGDAKNLRRMARLTQGHYIPYTGHDSITPLYEILASQANQYQVTYASSLKQPGLHQVEAGVVWNNTTIWSPPKDIRLTVKPPQVQVVQPQPGSQIIRKGDAWDADPRMLEPRTLTVAIEVNWPDGHPREIERVSYLADEAVVANLISLEPYALDISALPAGPHALRVEVEDSLGMIAQSDPIPITIDIQLPPKPTPEPTPTMDLNVVVENVIQEKVGERTSRMSIFALFALILALIALVLAVIILLRRPKTIGHAPSTLVGVVKDDTEVFVPRPDANAALQRARAYLVPVSGLGMNAEPIPITQRTVTIGRDPSRAQIVLPNKSVSRLHASIVEEEDGVFRLRDEGSTAGAYLNYQIVPAEGVVISPGDEIQLGRVRLIFQRHLPVSPTPDSPATPIPPRDIDPTLTSDAPSPFVEDVEEIVDPDRTEPFAD